MAMGLRLPLGEGRGIGIVEGRGEMEFWGQLYCHFCAVFQFYVNGLF